jgi:hypothetical protein
MSSMPSQEKVGSSSLSSCPPVLVHDFVLPEQLLDSLDCEAHRFPSKEFEVHLTHHQI